jgi:hypothetical protein
MMPTAQTPQPLQRMKVPSEWGVKLTLQQLQTIDIHSVYEWKCLLELFPDDAECIQVNFRDNQDNTELVFEALSSEWLSRCEKPWRRRKEFDLRELVSYAVEYVKGDPLEHIADFPFNDAGVICKKVDCEGLWEHEGYLDAAEYEQLKNTYAYQCGGFYYVDL